MGYSIGHAKKSVRARLIVADALKERVGFYERIGFRPFAVPIDAKRRTVPMFLDLKKVEIDLKDIVVPTL